MYCFSSLKSYSNWAKRPREVKRKRQQTIIGSGFESRRGEQSASSVECNRASRLFNMAAPPSLRPLSTRSFGWCVSVCVCVKRARVCRMRSVQNESLNSEALTYIRRRAIAPATRTLAYSRFPQSPCHPVSAQSIPSKPSIHRVYLPRLVCVLYVCLPCRARHAVIDQLHARYLAGGVVARIASESLSIRMITRFLGSSHVSRLSAAGSRMLRHRLKH